MNAVEHSPSNRADAPAVDEGDRWAQPQVIDALTRAFPAHVAGSLIPVVEEVPEPFWSWSNVWARWAQRWFGSGWPMDFRVFPRDDVDPEVAAAHLHTVLMSFEPKHEHKIAAVAYLGSRWFDSIRDES